MQGDFGGPLVIPAQPASVDIPSNVLKPQANIVSASSSRQRLQHAATQAMAAQMSSQPSGKRQEFASPFPPQSQQDTVHDVRQASEAQIGRQEGAVAVSERQDALYIAPSILLDSPQQVGGQV